MLFLLTAACQKDTVEYPDGLEPLEENLAPAPEGDGDWPEALSMVSGDDGGVHWTHARGYVQTALEPAVAAVEEPEVGVDRRRVASWEVTEQTEPEYEVSYTVHTVVEDVITVAYDLAWRHGQTSASTWGTRWQKTEGEALITLIEGSVLTAPVAEDAVELQFVYHLEAALTSTEDTEAFVSDFYASVLASAHGEPLPTWP